MLNRNVLIIEDDCGIREGVRILLEGEGYKVKEAKDGIKGLEELDEDTDIVILDVMMPGISGIKTCEEIRKRSNVPILFLTAKSQESDKLLGLMAGGDDYVVKPFSYAELLGRIKALLRRRNIYDKMERYGENKGQGNKENEENEKSKEEWIVLNNIQISKKYNRVYLNNEEISLTETEYNILHLLMSYPQKVFTVQNIYESVWGGSFEPTTSNTVMVYIRKLRKKIEENPQKPRLILTVWGKGYRFGN